MLKPLLMRGQILYWLLRFACSIKPGFAAIQCKCHTVYQSSINTNSIGGYFEPYPLTGLRQGAHIVPTLCTAYAPINKVLPPVGAMFPTVRVVPLQH